MSPLKAIRTFFRELGKSHLKCKRIGHKVHTYKITGLRLPSAEEQWERAVAYDYTGEVEMCARCGKMITDMEKWRPDYQSSLQGLTMPSPRWKLLKEVGYLIDDKRRNDRLI